MFKFIHIYGDISRTDFKKLDKCLNIFSKNHDIKHDTMSIKFNIFGKN